MPTMRAELYNLASDSKESRNLVTERPDVACELTQLALDWRRCLSSSGENS